MAEGKAKPVVITTKPDGLTVIAQAVNVVLDMAGAAGQDSRALDKAAKQQTDHYRKKLLTVTEAMGLSFADSTHRLAYVRNYVRSHSLMVLQILRACKTCATDFYDFIRTAQSLKVASMGGGPGSDTLGLLQFLDCEGAVCPLNVTLLDLVKQWMMVWDNVFPEVAKATKRALNTQYYAFDALKPEDIKDAPALFGSCDLVSCVKFASAVHAGKPRPFYDALFTALKPGAFVLVVDNWCPPFKADNFTSDCKAAADAASMQQVFFDSKMSIDSSGIAADLADIKDQNILSQEQNVHCAMIPRFALVYVFRKPPAPVAQQAGAAGSGALAPKK